VVVNVVNPPVPVEVDVAGVASRRNPAGVDLDAQNTVQQATPTTDDRGEP
jgi:hypothetical protein